MKPYMLITGGVLALLGGAAQAAPTTSVSGYVGMGWTYAHSTDNDTYDYTSGSGFDNYAETYNALVVNAAASLPVTDHIGAQADLQYESYGVSTRENDNGSLFKYSNHGDANGATGHVFYRTDQWLLGGFVGEATQSVNGGQLVGGGGEGQYYLGPWTLEAAVGVAKVNGSYYGSQHPMFWAAHADARYLVTPDLEVGAHLGYLDGSVNYGTVWQDKESGPRQFGVGVSGEYRLHGTPFTFTAAYDHANGKISYTQAAIDPGYDHYSLAGDLVSVGVRWTFGGSIADREQHGPSLDSFVETFGGELGVASAFSY
jgi:hypothetical protein